MPVIKVGKRIEGPSRPRHLRRAVTAAESHLWNALRARRLGGFKFRRQHPVGPFVVDFCCPGHRLVVEIDGDVHAGREQEDQTRTEAIEERGYFVIRFTNEEVLRSLDTVLGEIHRVACRRVEASDE